jgi:hypothetical protein
MYPLNLSLAAPAVGFAVANDEAEHAELTAHGYQPALNAAPQETEDTHLSDDTTSTPAGAAPKRKYTRKEAQE